MTRVLALTCSDCRRKFGGQQTFDRHRHIAGDKYRCRLDAELRSRGFYPDRWGVWHRGADPRQTSLLPVSESVNPVPETVPWDLEEGKRLRDEGMARVSTHSPRTWRQDFDRIVRDFRRWGRDWTSEDVTARIGLPPETHPNAVGAITRAAAVRHGAVKVGRVKAQRANQHATEIALWGWR